MGDRNTTLPEEASFYSELLRAYLDSANDAIFVLCDEMKFLVCNQTMQQWLGKSEAELTRHNQRIPLTELLGADEAVARFRAEFSRAIKGHPSRMEVLLSPPHSNQRWIEINMTRVDLENGDMVIAVARDTTERRQYLDRIGYQSTHDELTGLPNREVLKAQLEDAVNNCEQGGRKACLIVIDLDRFREINESLGHQAGDRMLQQTSARLASFIPEVGAARLFCLGGDEFAVVLRTDSIDRACTVGERLRRRISEPLELGLYRLCIDASVGIAAFPDHALDAESLLRRSEIAMYAAKAHRCGVSVYDPAFDNSGVDRIQLLSELREAIMSDKIEVHYQPIVAIDDHSACGLEALARWSHPSRGFVDPTTFVSLAEQSGLIFQLTRSVCNKALGECAGLLRSGTISSVSLNLSAYCLLDEHLPGHLTAMLQRHDFDPARIKFELTESAMMTDSPRTRDVMDRLKAIGVAFSVDDFGTGYSSLGKLRELPVSELKVDRSFVKHVCVNEGDRTIVRAAVQLAHGLGVKVVVEGVEDAATWGQVRELGCDYAQGFWIAYPMPFDAISQWLIQSYERGAGT